MRDSRTCPREHLTDRRLTQLKRVPQGRPCHAEYGVGETERDEARVGENEKEWSRGH